MYNPNMNITQEFETIAAIATPIGTGGVGVIRISGNECYDIIKKIFPQNNLIAGKISHGWIENNGTKIDEVIILPFKAPFSYTGEDVIEIQCHGGINVVRNILDLVLENGARLAERGEFTKRAFLNQKLDLAQAEAVADLIHAKTQKFAIKSAKNLYGVLSQKTNEIKRIISEILAKIIAGIDFSDDVKEPDYDYLKEQINNALKTIEEIISCAKASNILRQGIKVAILGKPNVGKSSLFNKLLNMERAIVTDIAGTTRDVLKETLDMGVSVTLIDTAGIRNSNDTDKVEEIGIEYSKQSAQEADLILFLYNAQSGMNDEDKVIYELIKNKPHLIIANKCDLIKEHTDNNCLYISTLTSEGLDELKQQMENIIHNFSNEDTEFITNKRQQDCLFRCKKSLLNALDGVNNKVLQDLISIDVKEALMCLNELTGENITDEILADIFDNFCIGK